MLSYSIIWNSIHFLDLYFEYIPQKPEFRLPDQTKRCGIEPPINDKFKHEGVGADWEAARLCFQKELLYIKHYFTFTHIHTSSFYLVLVKIWVSNFNVTTSSHSMVLFSSAWFEFSLQVFIFVNSIWFFRTFLLTGKENGKMNTEYIDIFGDDMFIFFHWKIITNEVHYFNWCKHEELFCNIFCTFVAKEGIPYIICYRCIFHQQGFFCKPSDK